MRKKGQKDLFFLASKILGFSRMTNDFHLPLAKKMLEKRERPIRLWLLPRGHYKTSLLNVSHNIWLTLQDPDYRILVVSSILSNASDMINEAGNYYLRDELFRTLYTEWCPQNAKNPDTTWSRYQIELPNRKDIGKMEKTFESLGADSSVVSRHYNYMKFDDLVAPGNIETPELRKKVRDYFKACLSLREYPGSPIDVIGTRWHDDDLYGEIMKWSEVETIRIPAEYYNEDNVRCARFPEVYPLEELDKLKRDQGSYLYSSLYMLDPIPEEMQLFKRSWFVDFDWIKGIDEVSGYQRMRREDDGEIVTVGHRFMSVDPAVVEGRGDYSVIMVTTTDSENNWYILDMWRKQCNPMELADKIIEMNYYWFPLSIGIEAVCFQQMLKFYLDEVARREGIFLPLQEIQAGSKLSKEIKIKSLQPHFESKCIYFPKEHLLTPIIKEELERFPAGKTDDLADDLQMQRELIFPSRNVRQRAREFHSLEAWKERLKKWHKDPGRYFRDQEYIYNTHLRGS